MPEDGLATNNGTVLPRTMNQIAAALTLLGTTYSQAETPKMTLSDEEREAEAVIEPASPQTELAVKQIKLPEGLTASLWAAEPMLANPVAFDIDNQGQIYVSETYRYRSSVLDIRGYRDMLEEDMAFRTVQDRIDGIEELFGAGARLLAIESERIRFLKDTDGDGRADYSSLYAEDFDTTVDGIASGVLIEGDRVLFSNIPNIWSLSGMNEEGQATEREIVHTGFGVHFGYTGHDLHGLTLGPDGKLYFSIGDRGAHVETKEGTTLSYPDTGAVYRCNMDGTELEVIHWGLRNPQELAFDEFGNLFTGDNDCDNGDYERLVLIADGGDSGWRIGHQHAPLGRAGMWMSEGWWQTRFPEQPKFLLPPICYVDDGPSGIAYYPGTGFSERFDRTLFITHFKGSVASSGITSYRLEADGAWFNLADKQTFLEGILPTDVDFGPDGRFYALDWVEGWPKSAKGRIYSIEDTKARNSEIVRETEQILNEGMKGRNVPDLTELLSHPNWNVRLGAQLELVERGDEALEAFEQTLDDSAGNRFARVHALWGIGILADRDQSKAYAPIIDATQDNDLEIRAQAVKLIGDHRIEDGRDVVVQSLQDDSTRVRYFAAQSAGKLAIDEAKETLVELARVNRNDDPYLTHGIVMGLVGIEDRDFIESLVKHDSPDVRLVAVLSLRRLEAPQVAKFLKDSDEQIVLAAARAINDAAIDEALPQLAATLSESPFKANESLALRALNAHLRVGTPENAAVLAAYAADPNNAEALRTEALTLLQSWESPFDRDRIMGLYRPLDDRDGSIATDVVLQIAESVLSSPGPSVQEKLAEVIEELKLTEAADLLYNLVLDPSKSGEVRRSAYKAFKSLGDPRLPDLTIQASQSNASELRLATLPEIIEHFPEQAEPVLAAMVTGTPEEQQVAYTALADATQPFAQALLLDATARLAQGDVPYAAQLELIEAVEEHPDPRISEAYQDYIEAPAEGPYDLRKYEYALEGGTSQPDGRAVFVDNKILACVRCHVVNGPGEAAGPNLSDVGLRLSRRELLESVVYPNAAIAEGYDNTIVTHEDGTVHIGSVTEETASSITLKTANDGLVTIDTANVANKTVTPSSMPPVFHDNLTRTEMRDLIEFLSRQRTDIGGRTTHAE